MLSCKETSMPLSQAQERRLALRERIGLQLHLLRDGCTNFPRKHLTSFALRCALSR